MSEQKSRPKVNSESQKELDKVEKQFEAYEEQITALTMDRMNTAPKVETEQQTKLSENEIANSKDVYLKPIRTIASREKFNEKFRSDYEFQKEYVQFIAENKEIIGEGIEIWTKPFPGMPAQEWKVPVNKPVWGPRYLAEQIKRKSYHRLKMDDRMVTGSDQLGTSYTGSIVVDEAIPRLDAFPVHKKRSVFF